MKRFYLLALGLLFTIVATAQEFEVDGICYSVMIDNTVRVSEGSNGRGCVVIPENITYNGTTYSVTSIDYQAFYGCTGLTSIEIPNSVTSIGWSAFENCTGLTSIEIPNSVTSIEGRAFSECTSLTSITIPNSVTSIGYCAFTGCKGLASVEIPNSVTSIGDWAFSGCKGLASIEIPNSVTRIGWSVFSGCSSLTDIVLNDGITAIGDEVFSNCIGLESITVPNSITYIGNNAFSGCVNIKEVISNSTQAPSLGEKVFEGIADDAILICPNGSNYTLWKRYFSNFTPEIYGNANWFVDDEGCAYVYDSNNASVFSYEVLSSYPGYQSIKKIYIDGFLSIGERCFAESSIEEVYIIDGIKKTETIAAEAFCECSNLTCVKFNDGLKRIGNKAFYNCRNLEYVQLPSCYLEKDAFASTGIEFVIIHHEIRNWGSKTISNYKNRQVLYVVEWPEATDFNGLKGDGMEYLLFPEREEAYDCGSPDGYFAPGYEEYYVLNNKVYVWGSLQYLNHRLDEIDYMAAEKIIYTPDAFSNRTTYDYDYFALMKRLNKPVDILKGVGGNGSSQNRIYTVTGSNAIFCNQELIAGCAISIIPEGTKSIAKDAFSNCKGLKSVDIPSSVTAIGAGAFTNCVDLTSIHVDENNAVYDSRHGCNAIIETASNKMIVGFRETVIPTSVTSIGSNAFSVNTNADVVIPANVTAIDKGAFKGANNLYFESEIPAEIAGDIFGRGMVFVPDNAYDTYCSADVWSEYKEKITTRSMSEKSVEAYSSEGSSGVFKAIGFNDIEKVVKLKVKGRINSYDIILFRDKMPLLSDLDLSEATVVASNRPYYNNYYTGNNTLGGYAFYDLDHLVNVKLPKNLEALGEYAFAECDNLISVDASYANNLDISPYAFYNCPKLEMFLSPENINNIENSAFNGCENLTELELHNVIGSIAEYAFQECGLLSIKIDSIGGSIQSSAFWWAKNLKDVRIGTIAGNIESEAFDDCYSLGSVEIGKGPLRIGSKAFHCCDNLKSFVAHDGVLEVADNAFSTYRWDWNSGGYYEYLVERKNLETVVLPQCVQKIGKEAFIYCTSLRDLSIPESVTVIGESAFEKCYSMERVDIPSGVTEIPAEAFYECTSLKDVTFHSALETIGERAFGNSGVKQLKLPSGLRSIEYAAFENCNSLQELRIPSSMENIGDRAFDGCDNLTTIYTYTLEPIAITENTFSTIASATLYVPATSFQDYYWNAGWSKFNYRNFKEFNEPYEYFYLNGDYYLNSGTGYIEGNPDADLRAGSGLVVGDTDYSRTVKNRKMVMSNDNRSGETMQHLSNVNVYSDGNGVSASIIGDDKLFVDSLHIRMDVKAGKWYFLSFPFDIPFGNISLQGGSEYAFCYYDGAARANNGNGGWKNVNDSYLKATHGYIFQSSADDVLILTVADVQFDNESKFCNLVTYPSKNPNNASWNLVGNPYLSYYDMADWGYTAPVTVWDGQKYVAVRSGDDDYCFAPCEAFFVQKPEGKEELVFDFYQQKTKLQSAQAAIQYADACRAQKVNPARSIVNICFADENSSDQTRVVFNEQKTHNYEMSCDAAKFETAGIPQVYTIDEECVRYAINERPMGNGVVFIGYSAPTAGYCSINAERMDAKVFLYDAETGVKHYFEDGEYRFYTPKGTYERRLSLGVRGDDVDETTAIEKIDSEELKDGVEAIYDLQGRRLKHSTDKGVYIIESKKVVK